jgi:hypothetical protein
MDTVIAMYWQVAAAVIRRADPEHRADAGREDGQRRDPRDTVRADQRQGPEYQRDLEPGQVQPAAQTGASLAARSAGRSRDPLRGSIPGSRPPRTPGRMVSSLDLWVRRSILGDRWTSGRPGRCDGGWGGRALADAQQGGRPLVASAA